MRQVSLPVVQCLVEKGVIKQEGRSAEEEQQPDALQLRVMSLWAHKFTSTFEKLRQQYLFIYLFVPLKPVLNLPEERLASECFYSHIKN